jgi:acyl-CoA oxidase
MEALMDQEMSPGMLSVIPLFYVGWADAVLSPSEFSLIHRKIDGLDFLSKTEKSQLKSWTQPNDPPPREIFRWWISEMQRYAKTISIEDRNDLVSLGLQMALQGTKRDQRSLLASPKTRVALEELRDALGVTTHEDMEMLLHKIKPSAPKDQKEPSFSSTSMQDILDSTFTDTRQRVRKLLRDPVFTLRHYPVKEDYRKVVLEWTKELARQGFGAYAYPKEFGGKGDPGAHITVFEMLGYHDLSLAVKFGVQFGLFGSSIYHLGTDRHHRLYLEALASGNLLGCFAMTETGHGSNVRGLETTLTYDRNTDEIIVHTPHEGAGKEYIGNALHSTMGVVFGQLIIGEKNYGVHAAVVPLRDQEHNTLTGVRIEDNGYKMGLNGVDNGKLWFDQVRVPRTNLLDRYGSIDEDGLYQTEIKSDSRRFFTMLSALVAGRVSVAWAGVSAAKKALTIAIRYALKRRQFASKEGAEEMLIMDYPSHQRRLMPLLARAYALDFAMKDLTRAYVDSLGGEDNREVESLAAGLKAMTSWFARDTIQEAREACGGKGYLAENQLAALKADTDIFTTFEGDNTVLLQLVAKGLLSAMQKHFHDEGFMAVMRFVTQRLSHTVSEYNVYQARRTDSSHLLDSDFFKFAFQYRLEKLLDTVAQRMRKYIGKRVHPTDAFLRCQNHMVALAMAHVEWEVLRSFHKGIHKIEDGDERRALEKVYQLYALSTIESNKDFFLENDVMNGNKTKAIRRLVNKLCLEVREDVEGYVDAFGIPDDLIGAPIAL